MHYNNKEMPKVDLEKLATTNREAFYYAEAIVKKDGSGSIRASRPTLDRDKPETGERAYVWRMLVFYVSSRPKHQCMPVMAECYLPQDDYDDRKDRAKELDVIVDTILDAVPAHERYGLKRWGEAFGMIGTPRYAPDGSVIYRDSWGN